MSWAESTHSASNNCSTRTQSDNDAKAWRHVRANLGPQIVIGQTQHSIITRLGTSAIEMPTISRSRYRKINQGWNRLIRSLPLDLSSLGTEK